MSIRAQIQRPRLEWELVMPDHYGSTCGRFRIQHSEEGYTPWFVGRPRHAGSRAMPTRDEAAAFCEGWASALVAIEHTGEVHDLKATARIRIEDDRPNGRAVTAYGEEWLKAWEQAKLKAPVSFSYEVSCDGRSVLLSAPTHEGLMRLIEEKSGDAQPLIVDANGV